MNRNFKAFKRKISNPVSFRLFMLTQLPSAWFAGVRVEGLNEEAAAVSVRQKWFNKNPFRSVYVAILSMPAEISTGMLCMGAIYNRTPSVSMLPINMEATFIKKATGKIIFTCNDGVMVNDAVEKAICTNQAVTVRCTATGRNEKNEVVATFYFTWSLKARSS